MIWILLATLGVPVWLILGALAGALWSRRKFRVAPGVFPCKIRITSGSEGHGKWTRATTYARWVHDVLLVHTGLALVRYRTLTIASVDGQISKAPGDKVKGGPAVSIRVQLDDVTEAEVAGPGSMRKTLSGPFLALHQTTTEAPTA